MNYNNKKFKPIKSSENGETSPDTVFHYVQNGKIISSEYSGGNIKHGHLLGVVDKDGNIEMCYHQTNKDGETRTGTCFSKPEVLKNGKIRLHENWQWTSGDRSKGSSIIEEI